MKIFVKILSLLLAVLLAMTAVPISALASPSFNQIVNAATEIIMTNEGNYTTVVRDDNGALSIGKICWHATNALNLLKDIVALNPSQALDILGASLYNEIITYSHWETRIPSSSEADALRVLLSTSESRKVQDETAWSYISGYINHGMQLGITEPEGLIFFADYENQNGKNGSASFFYKVQGIYGSVNLGTLYECSSKNSRRTRTYNFCATVNWNNYTNNPSYITDNEAPVISGVAVSEIKSSGYTVNCVVSDNENMKTVFFAVFYKADGADTAKWYNVENTQNPVFVFNISDFGNRTGAYCTYIYAFDEAGNYSYVQLNDIVVPDAVPENPPLGVTVSAVRQGNSIKWQATASNGSGKYMFSFEVYRDGVAVARRASNDFADYSYTVSDTGSYYAVVTVTDTDSGETAKATSANTDIFTPVQIDSFTSTESQIVFGGSVVWSVEASGGEGELKYSFTVYNGDKIVYSSDFSANNKCLFKPDSEGLYNATVTVMDSRSQVVSKKSDDVNVILPLSVNNASFGKDYAVVGMDVTCFADVAGGVGDYQCVFNIYCDGELLLTSQPVNSGEFTFTVSKAGQYSFGLSVSDTVFSVEANCEGLKSDEFAARGDANCDSKITALDARLTLRVAAGLEVQPQLLFNAADVNGDGKITAADARQILRAVARLEKL